MKQIKHLLIDANNLLYRAHYVTPLTDRKGRRVSGIHGVMQMSASLIYKFKPKNVVIVWDLGKCEKRLKIYPEYKAQRDLRRSKKEIMELAWAKERCQAIFNLLPVKQLMLRGIEADDIIGILCERLKGQKMIVSNDQDFYQLIHKDVVVFNSGKDKVITEKVVSEILGFPIKHYLLYKSMVGDASDNIKGINGIGPVKAKRIILSIQKSHKKLPINSEEKNILDRNKYLMCIGAMINDKDISNIKKIYKKERKKKINFNQVEVEFARLNFKMLLNGFSDWKYQFRGLM